MSSGDTSHMLPEAEGGPSGRRSFGTKIGFVMAAAGSAVGLGNLVIFPYRAGQNGGGAFVLIYLLAVVLVGLPLMYAELVIGRRGGSGIFGSIRNLTRHVGLPGRAIAALAGLMAIGACCLMLSFYSVIAGWGLHYLVGSFGVLPGIDPGDPTTFESLRGHTGYEVLWHSVFMVLTIVVVAGGVRGGIEALCNKLMPLLVLFLVGLLIYVAYEGWLSRSISFLFEPDFSKINATVLAMALGQAFFSLSLGMGTMVIYGSYMQNDRQIVRDGSAVCGLDTAIALLGGMVVFAVVFAVENVQPGEGASLLFKTLPYLFTAIPGGQILAVVFFILVLFAAWSSSISLLEVVTAYFIDEHGWARRTAAWLAGIVIWYLGIEAAMYGDVFSWRDEGLTVRFLFPLGGLLIAITAGWLIRPEDRNAAFDRSHTSGRVLAAAWLFMVRFVTPLLVIVVLLSGLGVLDELGEWVRAQVGG